jgi:hypothetical protein
VHIHARSKAEQYSGSERGVTETGTLKSDLEQQTLTAALSALAALKRARTDFLSAIAAPERARAAILSALASRSRPEQPFRAHWRHQGQA